MMYPEVEHPVYKVYLELEIPDTFKDQVEGMYLHSKTVSKNYTIFVFWLRYIFVLISLISGIIYLIFYFKTPKEIRTFEHSFIALLSISIILFNNPLHALQIYSPSTFIISLFSLF